MQLHFGQSLTKVHIIFLDPGLTQDLYDLKTITN